MCVGVCVRPKWGIRAQGSCGRHCPLNQERSPEVGKSTQPTDVASRERETSMQTHTHTHISLNPYMSAHTLTVQQDPKTTGKLLVWDLRLPWVSLMTACSHAFILGTLTSAHLHIKHQHMLERVHMHHCHTHTREMCEWINSCCSSSREWVATNSQQQDL